MNTNKPDLRGQFVVVTGGTGGLGAESVLEFISLGAKVLFTGRSEENANKVFARASLLTESDISTKLFYEKCDFTVFSDVLSLVDSIKRISGGKLNILMNNAGLISHTKGTTKDTCDLVVQTNHLSPFLLTSELFSLLKKTPNSRIVCLSSLACENKKLSVNGLLQLKDFNWETTVWDKGGWINYAYSKYYNMIFAETLNYYNQKENLNTKVVSVHPGIVRTDFSSGFSDFQKKICILMRPILNLFLKDLNYGSSAQMHCATVEFEELVSGAYYADCVVKKNMGTPKEMLGTENGIAVWNKTIEIIENRIGRELTGFSRL